MANDFKRFTVASVNTSTGASASGVYVYQQVQVLQH